MWTKEEQENLKLLLMSGVESNMLIAAEMLKQQKLPEDFVPMLHYLEAVVENLDVKAQLLKLLSDSNSDKKEYWAGVFCFLKKPTYYQEPNGLKFFMENFKLIDCYFSMGPQFLQRVYMCGKLHLHRYENKKLGLIILERMVFYNPDNFNYNYDYAYHLPDSEFDNKIKYYKKSLMIEPNSASPYLRMMELYAQQGQQENLLDALAECLDKKVAKTEFLVNNALDVRRKGQPLVSKKMLEMILQAEPDCHEAMNNLSFLLWNDLKEFDKALEIIQKAVELKPNEGLYWHTMAEVYFYGFKDKEKAINAILSGWEHAPQYNNADALLKEIEDSDF